MADALRAVQSAFDAMLDAWVGTIRGGGKILLFGNGGSAADAQHLATELVVRFSVDRAPLPGLALMTDSSLFTAAANDHGLETVFARQIEALGRKGDLALGISTSGGSANVAAGLSAARKRGLTTAALTAGNGGQLAAVADFMLCVPASSVARIQEMHILLGHMLCGAIEIELGLVPKR